MDRVTTQQIRKETDEEGYKCRACSWNCSIIRFRRRPRRKECAKNNGCEVSLLLQQRGRPGIEAKQGVRCGNC